MNLLDEMANDTRVLLHGDCLERLKELPANSVDSVVTDPPYGLSKEPDITEVLTKWMAGDPYDHNHKGFMGKEWDSFVPHPDVWREVYRVLKPGGHALVFAGTRTQDLMTISLRLAGFEIRDVIEWIYFSGFPKSLDISKAINKRAHRRNEVIKITEWIKEVRDNNGVTNRQIDEALGTNGMAGHYTTKGSQAAIPTLEKVPKLLDVLSVDEADIPEDIKYLLIDRNTKKREVSNEVEQCINSEKWQGWGTGLKPAHEPIIMARKPFEYGCNTTENVENHGTGAINIDASRLGGEKLASHTSGSNALFGGIKGGDDSAKGYVTKEREGRFPANCITLESEEFYSKHFNISPADLSKKASKKDRNSDWMGREIDLEKKARFDMEKGEGYGIERFNTKPTQNNHPTVKPIDLMAWLVRLITPPEGVVLDPFAGSGSTLVAAKREGFGFVGVERDKEYIQIIEARTGENAE